MTNQLLDDITREDIVFAEQLVAYLNHRGVWAVPATRCMYQIDKEQRELRLLNPEMLAWPDVQALHTKTADVFAHVGYTVTAAGEK